MNGAHMHLLVNHLPVIGSLFAILLLIWSLIRKNTEIARAALGLFVVAALTGLAAYFTGEPAEHMAEEIAGVTRGAIHTHEESAELATVLLSPAAASFDMFPDYAARGRAFKDAVTALAATRARRDR